MAGVEYYCAAVSCLNVGPAPYISHTSPVLMQGDWNAKIQAEAVVRTEREVHKLFTVMAERYAQRPGGYTRVVESRRRQHDSARMAYIE